jgi:hypothetical protein
VNSVADGCYDACKFGSPINTHPIVDNTDQSSDDTALVKPAKMKSAKVSVKNTRASVNCNMETSLEDWQTLLLVLPMLELEQLESAAMVGAAK